MQPIHGSGTFTHLRREVTTKRVSIFTLVASRMAIWARRTAHFRKRESEREIYIYIEREREREREIEREGEGDRERGRNRQRIHQDRRENISSEIEVVLVVFSCDHLPNSNVLLQNQHA